MRRAGVQISLDSSNWPVVGVADALRKYPGLRRGFNAIVGELCSRPPAVLVLIDYGYFNSRMARVARRLGLRIVYYFQPRSWSRSPGSAAEIAEVVDAIAAPFPWSVQALSGRRATVHWVGHPLLDVVPAPRHPEPAAGRPLVALVPGSRQQEIRHILPSIAEAAGLISQALPGVKFALTLAPGLSRSRIAAILKRHGVEADILDGVDYAAVGRAHAAIVTSGTATLELALLGVPMVVVYRVGLLNWIQYALTQVMGRRIRYIAMPNILANRSIVPELRQAQVDPRAIARQVLRLVTDPEKAERMRQELAEAVRLLGSPGAADAAARVVLSVMQGPSQPIPATGSVPCST
jgi:lipid-A-disaccharide synthase